MTRIRLTYLVPIVALGLTAVLLLVGYQEERQREQVWGPISSWDGPPPRGVELAMALNAPALLATFASLQTILLTLPSFRLESTPWWVEALPGAFFCVFALAQWIFIGWLLSRHQRFPSATLAGSVVRRVFLNALGIVVSLGFLWFGIYRMKTSGWMSTWIPGAGIAAWSLVAATAFAFRLTRVFASRRT